MIHFYLIDLDYSRRAVAVESYNSFSENTTARTIPPFPPGIVYSYNSRGIALPADNTRRTNAMLQILHRLEKGVDATPLTDRQLASKRGILNAIRRDVGAVMKQEGISLVSSWKHDLRSVDKQFFALMIEERASDMNIKISLCRNKWCAMNLLRDLFKAKKYALTKKQIRVEKVYNICYYKTFYRILIFFFYL